MTRRIFRSICLAALVVLLATLSVVFGVLFSHFRQVQLDQLRTQADLLTQGFTNDGAAFLSGLDLGRNRITWISSDGAVLYDSNSHPDTMENHLLREEIQEAQSTGTGESIRYSDTLMEQSVYVARQLPDNSVLRLSSPLLRASALLPKIFMPVMLVLLLVIPLALLLAKHLAHRIVRPLNELNLDSPTTASDYDELSPLLQRIAFQQRQLHSQSSELKRKQREFDAVTNNMNEGLILMNRQYGVLTMNPSAARIMGLIRPFVGINFLTLSHAEAFQKLLEETMEGEHREASIRLTGRVYQADASPVRSGGEISGIVLLLFDITQKQQAEAQRREFTANVSHELKTPLHAISGYAELLKSGMVLPSDTVGFSEKIHTEAQRMIRLVEDILKLSFLDEGTGWEDREVLDLYTLADTVLRDLAPTAQHNDVSLRLEGTSCRIHGVRHLLIGIITNLCTNAIKYNRPGGSVTITISEDENSGILLVEDTGIGIAPEHQERIFERFYRVDKSHSKSVGGTGLGLSIVKHAAMLHNAKIELSSIPGSGTRFTIRFPK